MYTDRVKCLFFSAVLFSSLINAGVAEEEKRQPRVYEPEQFECIESLGYSRGGGGSINLQFHNRCGDAVNLNVCVDEGFDEHRLYSSRVPKYGRVKIFIHRGVVGGIDWSSSTGTAAVPGLCAET